MPRYVDRLNIMAVTLDTVKPRAIERRVHFDWKAPSVPLYVAPPQFFEARMVTSVPVAILYSADGRKLLEMKGANQDPAELERFIRKGLEQGRNK